jgi:hypothetical protein
MAAKVGDILGDGMSLGLELASSTLMSRERLVIWEAVPKDAES